MKCRILDLDNCISDDAWRIPRIDWQHADMNRRYFNYHSLAPFDLLGNGQLLSGNVHLGIFTARPVIFREATEEWLRRNHIRPQWLMMRNEDENMPSVQLKLLYLRRLEAHYGVSRSDIEIAFDDRPDVVAMYRDVGVRAEVAAIHETCSMTPPSNRSFYVDHAGSAR